MNKPELTNKKYRLLQYFGYSSVNEMVPSRDMIDWTKETQNQS